MKLIELLTQSSNLKTLARNGIIPCRIARNMEIYAYHEQRVKEGSRTHTYDTAVEYGMTDRSIRKIIEEMRKETV